MKHIQIIKQLQEILSDNPQQRKEKAQEPRVEDTPPQRVNTATIQRVDTGMTSSGSPTVKCGTSGLLLYQNPQKDTPHPPTTYKAEHTNAQYHEGGRAALRDHNSKNAQQPSARRQKLTPFSPRCTQIHPPTITYLHLPFNLS